MWALSERKVNFASVYFIWARLPLTCWRAHLFIQNDENNLEIWAKNLHQLKASVIRNFYIWAQIKHRSSFLYWKSVISQKEAMLFVLTEH